MRKQDYGPKGASTRWNGIYWTVSNIRKVKSREHLYSEALLESIVQTPVLVGDLPEAKVWQGIESRSFRSVRLNFDQKLGHLYEDAFELLIEGSDVLDLLAKNLQIPGAKGQTLGEVDFLIRERSSGTVIHLEVAIKFYLAVRCPDGFVRYPGPDPRDSLQNKLQRMRAKQLRLTRTDEARSLLMERFNVDTVTVRQGVYGALFDRIDAEGISLPSFVSEGCRRGKWLSAEEVHSYWRGLERLWFLPKVLWPVEVDEDLKQNLDAISVAEVVSRAAERCIMVFDEARECSVFVVPNDWQSSIRY